MGQDEVGISWMTRNGPRLLVSMHMGYLLYLILNQLHYDPFARGLNEPKHDQAGLRYIDSMYEIVVYHIKWSSNNLHFRNGR